MAMTFDGFSSETFSFFAGLEKNNNKQWFEKNRTAFEADVKAPFLELLESLPEKDQPFKVFRINRDTRFSADKTPYKTSHSAVHMRLGGTSEYVQLDKQGLFVGVGHYVMEPQQLALFRAALDDRKSQQSFKTVIASLSAKDVTLVPGGSPPLKSAPRGVDPDHPMIEWMRWKGCAAMMRIPQSEMKNGPALTKRIAKWWQTVEPLSAWLEEHVT